MNIQLMTDGGADIPASLAKKTNLISVPLYLHFSDGEYKTGETLNLDEYHKKVRELNEVPQSASPSPHDFYEAYKKVPAGKPIIMLSISKSLSSTYENAVAGKQLLLEEEPERQLSVINTNTASTGVALLLQDLYKKAQKGYNFEALTNHLEESIEQTATLFVLDTLDNLIRGGRISKVTGTIAKTLNIKLLMREKDGSIEVSEKVRGQKKAIKRFINQIGEHTKNFENKSLFMTHCNCEPRAKSILDEIREKYPFKETFLSDTGPIIATHGGEGAIVISFFKDKK